MVSMNKFVVGIYTFNFCLIKITWTTALLILSSQVLIIFPTRAALTVIHITGLY